MEYMKREEKKQDDKAHTHRPRLAAQWNNEIFRLCECIKCLLSTFIDFDWTNKIQLIYLFQSSIFSLYRLIDSCAFPVISNLTFCIDVWCVWNKSHWLILSNILPHTHCHSNHLFTPFKHNVAYSRWELSFPSIHHQNSRFHEQNFLFCCLPEIYLTALKPDDMICEFDSNYCVTQLIKS